MTNFDNDGNYQYSGTCFAGVGVGEDQRLDGFLGDVIQTGHTGTPGPRERGRVVSICGEAIQYTQHQLDNRKYRKLILFLLHTWIQCNS